MFPVPNKITGSRKDLIHSYVTQLNDSNTKLPPPKCESAFRFCSYNVKYFGFEQYTSADIHTFIDRIQPDAFSLIEYEVKHCGDFNNLPATNKILFEQLSGYGILSAFMDTANIDANAKYLDSTRCLKNSNISKAPELRGFTHLHSDINSLPINIITVHLDVQDETGTVRLREIEEIYDYIRTKDLRNVLIMGDFNEWDLREGDDLYLDSLSDFQERTGLNTFSTKAHGFLKNHKFINVFHMKGLHPKFSCWSGKLVDFCYLFTSTWDNRLNIQNIYMPLVPFSDHLPLIVDIGIN